MADDKKNIDEEFQRACEEFLAAKISQGCTPEQANAMLYERFHQVRKATVKDRRNALHIVDDTPPDKGPA